MVAGNLHLFSLTYVVLGVSPLTTVDTRSSPPVVGRDPGLAGAWVDVASVELVP